MQQPSKLEHSWVSLYRGVRDVNRDLLDPLLRLNRIAIRTQGLLARKQVVLMEAWMEAAVGSVQTWADAASPQQLLRLQSQIVADVGERVVDAAEDVLAIQAQARDELNHWVGERFAHASGRRFD